MLTAEDVKKATFRRSNIGGYRVEDVDIFLNNVQITIRALHKENLKILEQNEELLEERKRLKADEEFVKNALITSQKLADNVLKEAKKKADILLEEATEKADTIIKEANKNLDQCLKEKRREISEQKWILKDLEKEATSFRKKLIEVYKRHIALMDDVVMPRRSEINNENEKVEIKAEILKEDIDKEEIEIKEENNSVVIKPTLKKYIIKPSRLSSIGSLKSERDRKLVVSN